MVTPSLGGTVGCGGGATTGAGGGAVIGTETGMGGFGSEGSRSGDVLPTGGLGFRIFGFGVGDGSRFRLPAGRVNISTRQWEACFEVISYEVRHVGLGGLRLAGV